MEVKVWDDEVDILIGCWGRKEGWEGIRREGRRAEDKERGEEKETQGKKR